MLDIRDYSTCMFIFGHFSILQICRACFHWKAIYPNIYGQIFDLHYEHCLEQKRAFVVFHGYFHEDILLTIAPSWQMSNLSTFKKKNTPKKQWHVLEQMAWIIKTEFFRAWEIPLIWCTALASWHCRSLTGSRERPWGEQAWVDQSHSKRLLASKQLEAVFRSGGSGKVASRVAAGHKNNSQARARLWFAEVRLWSFWIAATPTDKK